MDATPRTNTPEPEQPRLPDPAEKPTRARGRRATRRPATDSGGLAARVEAHLRENSRQPKGRGLVIAMVVAAAVFAVTIDVLRRRTASDKTPTETPPTTAAEAGAAEAAAAPRVDAASAPEGEETSLDLDWLTMLGLDEAKGLSTAAATSLLHFARGDRARRHRAQGSLVNDVLAQEDPDQQVLARDFALDRLLRVARERAPAVPDVLRAASTLVGLRSSRTAIEPSVLRRLAVYTDDVLQGATREAQQGGTAHDVHALDAAMLCAAALPRAQRPTAPLLTWLGNATAPLTTRILAAVALPRPLPAAAQALATEDTTPAPIRLALR